MEWCVYFYDEVRIPIQLWKWIDQSYQISQSNNIYINDILLPAQIIIVTLWIEFLCIVSDVVYYDYSISNRSL
jgi:hypothetical protein